MKGPLGTAVTTSNPHHDIRDSVLLRAKRKSLLARCVAHPYAVVATPQLIPFAMQTKLRRPLRRRSCPPDERTFSQWRKPVRVGAKVQYFPTLRVAGLNGANAMPCQVREEEAILVHQGLAGGVQDEPIIAAARAVTRETAHC